MMSVAMMTSVYSQGERESFAFFSRGKHITPVLKEFNGHCRSFLSLFLNKYNPARLLRYFDLSFLQVPIVSTCS